MSREKSVIAFPSFWDNETLNKAKYFNLGYFSLWVSVEMAGHLTSPTEPRPRAYAQILMHEIRVQVTAYFSVPDALINISWQLHVPRGIRGLKRKIGQESSGFRNHPDLKAYFFTNVIEICFSIYTLVHYISQWWKTRDSMVMTRGESEERQWCLSESISPLLKTQSSQ